MKKAIFLLLLLPVLAFSQNFPEYFKNSLIYYNNFDNGKINPYGIKEKIKKEHILEKGFAGKSYLSFAKWKDGVILISDKLSPANSLTISVWWALKEKHKEGSSFQILGLRGEGYISVFTRGGGKDRWCALKKPAGVLQVYNFPGIRNINGIYKRNIGAVLNLDGKKWNNTVITFTAGTNIKLYQNGNLFAEYNLSGRDFEKKDKINFLSFGYEGMEEVYFDEILILNRVLSADEVKEYFNMIKGLKEMGMLK